MKLSIYVDLESLNFMELQFKGSNCLNKSFLRKYASFGGQKRVIEIYIGDLKISIK